MEFTVFLVTYLPPKIVPIAPQKILCKWMKNFVRFRWALILFSPRYSSCHSYPVLYLPLLTLPAKHDKNKNVTYYIIITISPLFYAYIDTFCIIEKDYRISIFIVKPNIVSTSISINFLRLNIVSKSSRYDTTRFRYFYRIAWSLI